MKNHSPKIVETEGRIQLLLDWCGFTSRRDLEALEQLQNDPELLQQVLQERDRRTYKILSTGRNLNGLP